MGEIKRERERERENVLVEKFDQSGLAGGLISENI